MATGARRALVGGPGGWSHRLCWPRRPSGRAKSTGSSPAASLRSPFWFPILALERQGAATFKRRVVHYLGDASYSIYLAHLYAVVGLRVLCDKLHLPITIPLAAVIFIGACMAVGVGGGCLVYQFVERPLTNLARRLFLKRRAPITAEPAVP